MQPRNPVRNSAPRNAAVHPQPRNVPQVQPRNAATGPIRNSTSRNAAPQSRSGRGTWSNMARAPVSMTRNTSYPVNNVSRSSSRSSNSNPFPGRGPPIQSIRTSSRSNSSQRTRGAPIQSIRSSRSTSREPQRPVTSNPPRPIGSTCTRSSCCPPSNSRPMMSQPPTAYPASSGSTVDARNVVISFDTNQIITDLIAQRLRTAGVNAPVNIQIEEGQAIVSFNSSFDASLALRSRLSQMEVRSVGQANQTKI